MQFNNNKHILPHILPSCQHVKDLVFVSWTTSLCRHCINTIYWLLRVQESLLFISWKNRIRKFLQNMFILQFWHLAFFGKIFPVVENESYSYFSLMFKNNLSYVIWYIEDHTVDSGVQSMIHGPAACLCEWSCIGTQTCPFIYVLSMSAFVIQWQRWVFVMEKQWPSKPKIFTVKPFKEKVYRPPSCYREYF